MLLYINPLSAVRTCSRYLSMVLGVVLGAALIVGREFMDRSIHDARALQSEFEIPVLGEIPRIQGSR